MRNTKIDIATAIVDMLMNTGVIQKDTPAHYSDLILDIQDVLSDYFDDPEVESE